MATVKVCKTCNKEFIPKDDRPSRPAKFCSRKCTRSSTQFQIGHKRTPLANKRWDNPATRATWFKKGVHSYPLATTFKKGFTPWNVGKDFGGNEYLAKRISWLQEYKIWRKKVRIRDQSRCVKCGNTEKLNVDHYPISLVGLIRRYKVEKPQQAKKFKKFWDIGNGRTLCVPCHKKTDTYGKNFMHQM